LSSLRSGSGKATADSEKTWKERIYDFLIGFVHALTVVGIIALIIRYVPEGIYTYPFLMPPGAADIPSAWSVLELSFTLTLVLVCLWVAVRVYGGVFH